MKWLVNTVSGFFVNPDAYIKQCHINYNKTTSSDLYNYMKTAIVVGASSGLVTYIVSGLVHSGNANLGIVTAATVSTIYLASRIHDN